MTGNLKFFFLALLVGGMGAVALIDRVAIGQYPPVAHLPGGATSHIAPSEVRRCMSARVWSSMGDASSTVSSCIAPLQTIRPTGSSPTAWHGIESAQPSSRLTTDVLRSSRALAAWNAASLSMSGAIAGATIGTVGDNSAS